MGPEVLQRADICCSAQRDIRHNYKSSVILAVVVYLCLLIPSPVRVKAVVRELSNLVHHVESARVAIIGIRLDIVIDAQHGVGKFTYVLSVCTSLLIRWVLVSSL